MTTKVNYEKKIIERSYGMATVIWGPLFWSFMNDIANIYDHHWLKWDIVTREKMESFWKILCSVLPCRYCRESYSKYYKENPPKYPFIPWICSLHNKVNAKLGKPEYNLSSFVRKSKVYSSFSSINTLTDIHFILALNYCYKTKKKYYKMWFEFLPEIIPFLVKEKNYPLDQVKCYFNPQPNYLTSKILLIKWLISCQPSPKSVSYYILKYAESIAHDTIEELALICGNLIKRCFKQ
jgi:hypothetical protein